MAYFEIDVCIESNHQINTNSNKYPTIRFGERWVLNKYYDIVEQHVGI